VILGGSGNDQINGGGDNDTIFGGPRQRSDQWRRRD